jgi:hypothetical protein
MLGKTHFKMALPAALLHRHTGGNLTCAERDGA